MRILMLVSQPGAANAAGSVARVYRAGETLTADEPWQADMFAIFVREGWARDLSAKMEPPHADKAIHAAPENKSGRRPGRPKRGDR